jgi:hypothetical protein
LLAGQKEAVIHRLRAEQRAAAMRGDRVSLEGAGALLRRVLAFSIDASPVSSRLLKAGLVVLSPQPDGSTTAHVLADGLLVECFRAGDVDEARQRAQRAVLADEPREDREAESAIVLRWLCALGPGHRIEPLPPNPGAG